MWLRAQSKSSAEQNWSQTRALLYRRVALWYGFSVGLQPCSESFFIANSTISEKP